jgi:hypothetical protein
MNENQREVTMGTTLNATAPTDNLNPPPSPSRVYYSLGRMLGVSDFQADQDYHRGCLARALLQLCGTGTVFGLYVSIPQIWQASTAYPAWAYVYDSSQNVQVNTGTAGTSGAMTPAFATTPGGTVADGTGIVWTNEGEINQQGWRPNAPFTYPTAIVDSNSNVQILTGSSATFTAGPISPAWSTAIGATTVDGAASTPAWTCVGPWQLEIAVNPGLAIDGVGRLIEVPSTVCIRIQPWLSNQAISDLNSALTSGNGNILADVFATFVPCTQGVTPCFATQDDYDATDAFSPNRLLDSFSMQLVLRNDASPQLPKDRWLPLPTGAITPTLIQALQNGILAANVGPAANSPFTAGGPPPVEIPPGFDPSSVFLARISIPASAGATGQPPTYTLNNIVIDNFSRLFLYPPSLVARVIGLSSGADS